MVSSANHLFVHFLSPHLLLLSTISFSYRLYVLAKSPHQHCHPRPVAVVLPIFPPFPWRFFVFLQMSRLGFRIFTLCPVFRHRYHPVCTYLWYTLLFHPGSFYQIVLRVMAEIGYTRSTDSRYRVPLQHTVPQRLRTTSHWSKPHRTQTQRHVHRVPPIMAK